MGSGSVSESSKHFFHFDADFLPKKILFEFYCHKTPKHVSAYVLDSEEGHQRTPPDQSYDIICHLAFDSTGMFGLSLRVVSTDLSD
jgi:hypothetical protein